MRADLRRILAAPSVLLLVLPMTAFALERPPAIRAVMQPDGGLLVQGKAMDEDGLVELLRAGQRGARAVTIALTRPPQLLSLGPTATRIEPLAETLEIELPAAASARS